MTCYKHIDFIWENGEVCPKYSAAIAVQLMSHSFALLHSKHHTTNFSGTPIYKLDKSKMGCVTFPFWIAIVSGVVTLSLIVTVVVTNRKWSAIKLFFKIRNFDSMTMKICLTWSTMLSSFMREYTFVCKSFAALVSENDNIYICLI